MLAWLTIPAAIVGAVIGVVFLVGSLFGGEDDGDAPQVALAPPESSWTPGQPSLLSFAAYLGIAERAETLAIDREATRERELAAIEAARLAAREREREEARRRFLEAKRRAEARYRAALREAARKRREQARKLARLRKLAAERRRRYLESLRIDPGAECRLSEVKDRFSCLRGRLKPGKAKKKSKGKKK